MHIVNTKGTGSNTYVKVEDIVKALRAEANTLNMVSMEDRIIYLANNLEGIQFRNQSGNIKIQQ